MDQLPAVAVDGVLVLDKPANMSSASAVDRVRRALGAGRAGHGGTLDPIATGVLPICLGHATRLARFVLAEDKGYLAEGLLGIETATLDRTGAVTRELPVDVTRDALLAAIAGRLGHQDQLPPQFSAIKVGGRRSYKSARRGQIVEHAPRRIRIDRIELVSFESPRFTIAVECGKGTYIRSLVRDLGTDVGTCAHLTELRRTRAGKFTIAQAVSLYDLDLARLVPLEQIADLPKQIVNAEVAARIRNGVQLPIEKANVVAVDGNVQLVDDAGKLVTVAHIVNGVLVYDIVIPSSTKS